MDKKILVISTSPRRNGNSETLCDELIKGAIESGNKVEKVSFIGKKIGYCNACDFCKDNAGDCIQDDDMIEILEKMIDSDVIVLATPIYFYAIDAQMKTLIDRTYARYTEISNKEFYFIVTAEDSNKNSVQRAIEEFRGFTSCLNGAKEKGIIYGTGAWHIGDVKKMPVMAQAYKVGKSI